MQFSILCWLKYLKQFNCGLLHIRSFILKNCYVYWIEVINSSSIEISVKYFVCYLSKMRRCLLFEELKPVAEIMLHLRILKYTRALQLQHKKLECDFQYQNKNIFFYWMVKELLIKSCGRNNGLIVNLVSWRIIICVCHMLNP